MAAAAAETIDHVRPAQCETYGRSLRTIYRLGAFMVDRAIAEVISSPEASQARAEFYTSVEEGFGTDMELGGGLEVRDFDTRQVIDGKVMSKDLKTAISYMTEAGLACAEESAETDKRFGPQLERSKWDHENALIVDAMARGEAGYNTRIVVSPFPEEAAAQSGDEYWRDIGYVPHLKRGFVQVYHATKDGLIAGSLSFNGSNKQRLREVFAGHGINIPEAEITDNWLQYAITDTLSEEEAKALALDIANQAGDPAIGKTVNTVAVTREHRSIMDKVFNESYVHACESHARGHQTAEARKLIFQLANQAGKFNPRYARALYQMRANEKKFTDDDMVVIHELLVYSTIEMMRALHLRAKASSRAHLGSQARRTDAVYLRALDAEAFQHALSGFGAIGAQNNRIYSACGLSISPGEGEANRSATDPQSVFGGRDQGYNSLTDEDGFGPLVFQCKNGHWNKRPRGKLIDQCRVKSCKNSVAC